MDRHRLVLLDRPAWFQAVIEQEEMAKVGGEALVGWARLGESRELEYATMLAPDDAAYWMQLAAFCAENNVNINDVCIPAAQKAVQLSPKDAPALDVLGWTYSLAGRHGDAERMLFLALEHDPQYAPAYFHLAIVYLQTEDRVSAYDYLIRARDLGSAEADAALKQYFP